MVLSIVGTVLSPVNPLTDTIDMITNTLATTELEMHACTAYGVIKQ